MEFDRNEFFHQATLRICGSLDINKALLSFIQYIQVSMPVSRAFLTLFDQDTGIYRAFADVDRAGNIRSFPPIVLSTAAIKELVDHVKTGDTRIGHWKEQDEFVKILRPYSVDLTKYSVLAMDLALEGKRLGFLVLVAGKKTDFTQEDIELVSLLREPFSIAMSNALRYEEVLKLKEIVDAENRELSRELRSVSGSEIVGSEYGLKDVMEMVRQVAPLNSPVILLGETGVGKEVIANAIHYSSSRRGAPLVKVNCGAIPDTLVDSELFGHEKGAFTGAITQKKGRFERADAGTIFLDEVGELPPQAQVRLLRVLQEKEIERVGGMKTIPVDVRIIAATHRNITELIHTGVFREDLWFRLNVFPITIPPLRHRKEDIPALVNHFLEKKSKDLKIYPTPTVSIEEIERLKAYHWPGNIRELENLIERELIHMQGKGKNERLTFEHLQLLEGTKVSSLELERGAGLLTLNESISRQIRQALQESNGKISGPRGAAQLLGINPNTLRSRMRKLGIPFK